MLRKVTHCAGRVSANTMHDSRRNTHAFFAVWCALIKISDTKDMAVVSGAGAFPDEARIGELVEQMRLRCAHAQQLKQLPSQQQTPATSQQVAQVEEMQKRLTEVVFRLQEAVRDFSLDGILQRLKLIAQKLSLKFDVQPPQQQQITCCFLSCDAFFVEVGCHGDGRITGAKLVHTHSQQEESFTQLLCDHQFSKFESHLRALTELYNQVGAAERVSMFQALTATEKVLRSISESIPHTTLSDSIMNNPLGHVTPRNKGLPMCMTYFVHPYEVLKCPQLSSTDKNACVPDKVGMGGKMGVEKCTQVYNLCVDPNLFNRSQATFFPVTNQNSVPVAMTIVLELNSSFPVSASVMEQLHKTAYGADKTIQALSGPHINHLIAQSKADKEGEQQLCQDKCRLVCLPSQRHFYYLPSNVTSGDSLKTKECGVMLSKVPFIHPGHVFGIIPLLRKQLVYNTLFSSCLGRSSKNVPADPSIPEYLFDITTSPPDQITVIMDTQNSREEKIVVEFALPDQHPTKPVVRVGCASQGKPLPQPRLSEVAWRCLSVPVTLQAALKQPMLFGPSVAAIVQAYQHELAKDRTGGRGEREGLSGAGGLGIKRMRTE